MTIVHQWLFRISCISCIGYSSFSHSKVVQRLDPAHMVMDDEDDSNIKKQADEILAISSIYENKFTVDNEFDRTYSVLVDDVPAKAITLQVVLPMDYPSHSPPTFRINAPWLRGQQRICLEQKLHDTYIENVGETVLFQSIEEIRTFVQNVGDKDESLYESSHADDPQPATLVETREEPIDGLQHGIPITDRKSTFQAHLIPISDASEVKSNLRRLCARKKICDATHNIYAYRVQTRSGNIDADFGDDGEHHAGTGLLNLLELSGAVNVLVVVSRWYGGVMLGPDRFRHINSVAKDLLAAHGFIKQKKQASQNS